MKHPLLLSLSLICLLQACIPSSPLSQAQWLLGTWEQHTSRGIVYEHWSSAEQGMEGMSFVLREGDTVVLETVTLTEQDGALQYTPTVQNQNNRQPVVFRGTALSDTSMTFENPSHDFPQVISYQKVGADSLVATISGQRNGKQEARTFSMRRGGSK